MSIAPKKNCGRFIPQVPADERDRNPDEIDRCDEAKIRRETDYLEMRGIASATLWDFFASLWV